MLNNIKQWLETKVDSVLVDLEVSNIESTHINGHNISTYTNNFNPSTSTNDCSFGADTVNLDFLSPEEQAQIKLVMKKASEEELNIYKQDTFNLKKSSIDKSINRTSCEFNAKKKNFLMKAHKNSSTENCSTRETFNSIECQNCKLKSLNKNISQENFNETSKRYEEKCLNCTKIICEKCSILSSVNVGKDSQKFCILCKACSKLDTLNIEFDDNKIYSNRIKYNENQLKIQKKADSFETIISFNNEKKYNFNRKASIESINRNETSIHNFKGLNTQHKSKRTLPSTPFDTDNDNLKNVQKPIKLENVAEWLNKSFDQSKINSIQNVSINCRSNSHEPILQINDEPLIEISLNEDFYAIKKQQQQLKTTSLFDDLKSYNNLQKICIYKDPKELEKIELNKETRLNSRRKSSELGINISGCQNIHDLNSDGSLGALVTSIEPDGVIQKFKVEIEEGDEIVEINGFNLRNKSDEEIDEIFSTTCYSNNGEIELLVRRRSSVSSANDFNLVKTNHERELKKANQANESNIDIQSTSSSYEIQADLNEQSSIASSTFSSEQADSSQKSNHQNTQICSRQNSVSSSLSRQLNHQHNNSNNVASFVKKEKLQHENSEKSDEKTPTSVYTRLNRIVSEPGASIQKSTSPIRNKGGNTLNLTHESSFKSNFLNIENNYIKSATPINLAKFRSSSPLENIKINNIPSNPNLIEVEFNNIKASQKLENVQDKKMKKNDTIKNQAVESNSLKPGPLGDLQVQIRHDPKEQQLIVTVLRATNLASKDANGFSDPFVKICLLPGRDNENKRRTNCIFKNLNPVWNCTVVYPDVYEEEVKNKTLELAVWDWDRFSTNDFIGLVRIDLFETKYLDNRPRWFQLQKQSFDREIEDKTYSTSLKIKRSVNN